MTGSYWSGFATPFVLAVVFVIGCEIYDWCRWWFIDPEKTFRGGKGSHHTCQTWFPADEWDEAHWFQVTHTHWWPPGTPWWFVHRMEWLRVRLCLRRPDYRPCP